MLAYARRHPRTRDKPSAATLHTVIHEPSRRPRRGAGGAASAYTPARCARFLVLARGARRPKGRAAARRMGTARGGGLAALFVLGRVGPVPLARRGLARGRGGALPRRRAEGGRGPS